jgi:hypothetical protein
MTLVIGAVSVVVSMGNMKQLSYLSRIGMAATMFVVIYVLVEILGYSIANQQRFEAKSMELHSLIVEARNHS